jgi:hypothetical protein
MLRRCGQGCRSKARWYDYPNAPRSSYLCGALIRSLPSPGEALHLVHPATLIQRHRQAFPTPRARVRSGPRLRDAGLCRLPGGARDVPHGRSLRRDGDRQPPAGAWQRDRSPDGSVDPPAGPGAPRASARLPLRPPLTRPTWGAVLNVWRPQYHRDRPQARSGAESCIPPQVSSRPPTHRTPAPAPLPRGVAIGAGRLASRIRVGESSGARSS